MWSWRPRARSLRGRLLVGVVAVTMTGVVAAEAVATMALQSYLDGQVDGNLNVAVSLSQGRLAADSPPIPLPGDAGRCSVVVVDAAGRELSRFGSADAPPVPPIEDIRGYAASAAPVTVDGGTYRVRVAQAAEDRFVIVSESVEWTRAVVHRLIAIELAVTLMVLVLAAWLAVWVSRVVLKPIDKVSATSALIADGELSHRVDLAGAPTEVARLGHSVNQMLGRIEHGFVQRQRADERLRQFVADAGHELRTPLTSITGYVQLVRKGALDEPGQLADAMRRVEDEAKRMAGLLDELFLLARLDEGRSLERGELDLGALVTAAVEDARAADPHRAWSLVVEPGEHLVLGDEHRLRQLMGNLLANVRAHTPPGSPAEVRVSHDGGAAIVDVVDSGPGVPPDQRDRIFERFYRADSVRRRVAGTAEGSGLGLGIVAAIADAHDGSAVAVPHTGGAWLRVTIPAFVEFVPSAL